MEEPLASALLAPVDDAISSTQVASMDRFPLSVVRVVGNIDCFVVENVVASNVAGFALSDTEVVAVDTAYIGLDIASAAIVVYVVAVGGVGNSLVVSLVRNAILCSQEGVLAVLAWKDTDMVCCTVVAFVATVSARYIVHY